MTKDCFKLYVRCFTFNHARYIKDTMDGFCLQQTNFPYVCIIVDDASSDGEQDVILSYLEQNFVLNDDKIVRKKETEDYIMTFVQHRNNQNCFFAVYLLKYNHYSIHKSKMQYFTEFTNSVNYSALCEGDDYWIDSNKLQLQVDFLESHSNYTMTCNRTQLFSEKQKRIIGESYCYNNSCDVDTKDVINRTGLFITTCSIVYRCCVEKDKPDYWKNCKVGDYPLQIACALKGCIYYFNKIMSVYRVENSKSWMGRQKFQSASVSRMEFTKSKVDMFIGFAKDYPEYRLTLISKAANDINQGIPTRKALKKDRDAYVAYFADYINTYNLRWKIDLALCKTRIPFIRAIYSRLFLKKYKKRIRKYYN